MKPAAARPSRPAAGISTASRRKGPGHQGRADPRPLRWCDGARVPLRDGFGRLRPIEEIDGDVAHTVAREVAAGKRVVLWAMDSSKFGLRSPSEDCLRWIADSADDKVMIVIDAAKRGSVASVSAGISSAASRCFSPARNSSPARRSAARCSFRGAWSSVAPPSTKCPTAWVPIPAATIGRRASRISARRCRRSSISARCCAGARRSPKCATITPCPIPSATSP